MQPANAIHSANNDELRPFASLKGAAQTAMDDLGMDIHYKRGDALFSEGERPKNVFLLSSGRIKLFVTSAEGKTVILRIAEPGEILGLSAAFSAKEHEVTAEAMEPCHLKTIPNHDFLAFLERYPEAAMEATRCVLHEYQNVFNEMCRLALPSTVAGRVANLLLEWRKPRFQSGEVRQRFMMTLTHEEIAGMTATSRETVSRVFKQFEREKLISIKGASLTVLQAEVLEQLAV